jgi:hypothetical protein
LSKYTTFTEEISSPIIWAVSVISKKLPKVNSHQIGENSPNLVTLVACRLLEDVELVDSVFWVASGHTWKQARHSSALSLKDFGFVTNSRQSSNLHTNHIRLALPTRNLPFQTCLTLH